MPVNKPLRLILDTNVWISFLISNRQSRLDILWKNHKAKLLFSPELLMEIQDTIEKPRLKIFFGNNAMEEMLRAFDSHIIWIEVHSQVTGCRDPKDNFLLALAKDGKADFLLTGDKDLLEMKSFGKTKITTITSFLDQLKHFRSIP